MMDVSDPGQVSCTFFLLLYHVPGFVVSNKNQDRNLIEMTGVKGFSGWRVVTDCERPEIHGRGEYQIAWFRTIAAEGRWEMG